MDQIERMAEALGLSKWETLRKIVALHQKRAEAALDESLEDRTQWASIPESFGRAEALCEVRSWMIRLEGNNGIQD